MRVLVTGAGGFLGRHVVERLLARGDGVTAVDRDLSGLPEGADAVAADVTDEGAIARAAEGAEAVIHAAAVTGLWARDPGRFDRVNHHGTRTVLAAAHAAGAQRGVLVSSYTTLISGGRGDPERVIDEREILPPDALLGAYPASKRRAEIAAAEAEMPTAILLPTAPIGPGDRTPTPPGAMLRDMANGRLPAMIDCGWNLVDVQAVADACLAALDRGEPGERYLLAGADMDTAGLLELFGRVTGVAGPKRRVPHAVALAAALVEDRLSRLTGRAPTAPLTGVRLAGPRLCFDASKARAELGFDPGTAEGAMRDALLWMRGQGWLTRDLPGLDQPAG